MSVSFNDPQSFKKNGFVIVKSVFTSSQVHFLRELSHNLINSNGSKRQLMPSDTLKSEALSSLLFNEKIVNSLKESLGEELNYIPDITLHSNQFGYPGWHTDSSSEVYNSYLQSESYKFAKCGIFLQDNTDSWGGGLEVLPRGHKYP